MDGSLPDNKSAEEPAFRSAEEAIFSNFHLARELHLHGWIISIVNNRYCLRKGSVELSLYSGNPEVLRAFLLGLENQ